MLIVSTKIQDRKTARNQFQFAQFRVLFFDFGNNKPLNGFFGCNLNTFSHMLGIFLWDGSRCKIYFS